MSFKSLIHSTALVAVICFLAPSANAGDVLFENKSAHKIKIASIGGSGYLEPNEKKSINFENEEVGADINIWWVKNARQLCQIFTPWDRTVTVTGKYTINCLSRN